MKSSRRLAGRTRYARTQPATSPAHSRVRIAVGIGLSAAAATMTSIATQTSGTFWAAHSWVAWALLGLLVAALVINEMPRLLSANYWLIILTALGLALSVSLWVSVHADSALPLDGSDPNSLTTDGTYPADSDAEQNPAFFLGGRQVGEVDVFYSQKDKVVWGGYKVTAPAGLPDVTVNVAIARSTDGRTMSAGAASITPGGSLQVGDGNMTLTLAFDPAACYTVVATLTAGVHELGSLPTTWCGPQHR